MFASKTFLSLFQRSKSLLVRSSTWRWSGCWWTTTTSKTRRKTAISPRRILSKTWGWAIALDLVREAQLPMETYPLRDHHKSPRKKDIQYSVWVLTNSTSKKNKIWDALYGRVATERCVSLLKQSLAKYIGSPFFISARRNPSGPARVKNSLGGSHLRLKIQIVS